MGLSGLLVTAFLVGLSGAMAPGSLLAVVITETLRGGFWAGPLVVLGHAIVEIFMVLALSMGLGRILSYPKTLGFVGLSGGLMLLYFGYSTLMSARSASLPDDAGGQEEKANLKISVAIPGIAATISNPYWILWWATVGAAYIASGLSLGPKGPIAFYLGHISSDFAWYAFVSFLLTTGGRFFTTKTYRFILGGCGVAVMLLGFYFLGLGIINLKPA